MRRAPPPRCAHPASSRSPRRRASRWSACCPARATARCIPRVDRTRSRRSRAPEPSARGTTSSGRPRRSAVASSDRAASTSCGSVSVSASPRPIERVRVLEGDAAVVEIERATDAMSVDDRIGQFLDARALVDRFHHELDRAAARQAEAVGFVGADAVADALRPFEREAMALGPAYLRDQVVLDAATRDRNRQCSRVPEASSPIATIAPTGPGGRSPHVRTIVPIVTRRPSARHATIVFKMFRSTLSMRRCRRPPATDRRATVHGTSLDPRDVDLAVSAHRNDGGRDSVRRGAQAAASSGGVC